MCRIIFQRFPVSNDRNNGATIRKKKKNPTTSNRIPLRDIGIRNKILFIYCMKVVQNKDPLAYQ